MTKKLHFILLALFAAVFNTAMAQEVTLDFTENTWGLPNDSKEKMIDAAQFTCDGYTVTLEGSSSGGYYYHTKGKYVLIGKEGASLTLPAFGFNVTKIAITGTSGASAAVKQNIFVGEEAVSTETTGAKDVVNEYDIAAAYQAAGTVYCLKITSAHNTQITKIEIYGNGAPPAKPVPEMSFEPNSVSVVIGETPTQPTLSYNGDGAITYSSSDEQVATVDAASGALNVLAVGTTTITATAAETANYKSATARYTLTVKNPPVVVDDAIWAENWDKFEAGTLVEDVANASATYKGDGQYVKLYGNTNDPTNIELLIPKSSRGVAFSADVNLGGKSGNLTLSYYANRSLSVTTTTGGATISEPTVADNVYTHVVTVAGGASQLNLTFSMATDVNARLDDIALTVSESQDMKLKPDMWFMPNTFTVTLGESFTAPTLAYNGDGDIAYSSSNEKVATVDAVTGAVTILSAGSATITATATETDKYMQGTATYILNVVEKDESDIVWKENWDRCEAGTLVEDVTNPNATYKGDGQYVKLYANSNDPSNIELLVPKESRKATFVASVKPNGKFGRMVLSFTCNHKLEVWSSKVHVEEIFDEVSEAYLQGITYDYAYEVDAYDEMESFDLIFQTLDDSNARLDNIRLALTGDARPVISGETPFSESTVVTITPSNPDFIVCYVIRTDDATPSYTDYDDIKLYTGPFTVTESCTVWAYEENYNEIFSPWSKKTFSKEFLDIPVVNSIAEFKALPDKTEATLKLNDAEVLWVNGADMYVRDATGAIDFYNMGLNIPSQSSLNGSVNGRFTTYKGLPEITSTERTNEGLLTVGTKAVTPKTIAIADAKSEKYYCDWLLVKGVKIVKKVEGSYTNIYAYIGNDSIMLYDRFGIGMGNYNETDTYDVQGILVPFNGKYELYITDPVSTDATVPVCNDIAAFKALDNNQVAELKLNNAQVVFASGNDVYVRDASGAIEFYATGIPFETNMMLNGSITGKLSFYKNLPELAKTEATNADKLTTTADAEPQPVSTTIAQLLAPTYICDLVEITNVEIVEDNGKLYATSGSDRILIYDKYKNVGEDLVGGVTATIKGICSIYNSDYQLLPLTYTLSSGIHDLTVGGLDPNAPIYNLSGQRVGANYKGIVMQNGRKFIKK